MSFARVIGVSAVFTFSANRAINQMTRASRGFDRLNTSAKSTQDTLRQGFAGLTGLGVAATAGIGFAVSKFADFDKAAMQLKSRLDASDPSFETMKQKALEVGGATKFTAAEVLTAMERFKQLGVSGKDVLTNIGMVAKFAASENISLEKAVRMGVVSTKVFGLETSKLSDVMNRMMFVSNNTAANTTELFNALRYVSGATKFTKSNFQEIVNMLGLFHNSALFGSRAGTAMTNMINKLSANAKQGTIQIGDYTAMIHKNKEGGLDLTQTMLNVATAFKRMTEDAKKSGKGMETVQRLADKLFGVRGARGVGALVDFVYGKDRDTLLKLYKTQESQVNKEIDKVYNIRVQNVKDAYIRMTSALDAFAISSMKNFKGPIYKTIENYTRLLTNAGKVVGLVTGSNEALGWSAQKVVKFLDPKGTFGLSTNTVELVRGFYSGFKNTLDIAVGLGKAVVYVGDTLAGWSKWLGLGKERLSGIAGMLVAGGVIMTALTALKYSFGLLLAPIGKVTWGIGAWVTGLYAANTGVDKFYAGINLANKALAGLLFLGKLYLIYKAWQLIAKAIDYLSGGALTRLINRWGDWFAQVQGVVKFLQRIGVLQETATNVKDTASNAATQRLAELEALRNRGVTTFGVRGVDGSVQRQNLTREAVTERVRQSLQQRGFNSEQIAMALKELMPRINQFQGKNEFGVQPIIPMAPIQVAVTVSASEVAKQVAIYQNNTKERNGKKVDRSMQQRGISQTRR